MTRCEVADLACSQKAFAVIDLGKGCCIQGTDLRAAEHQNVLILHGVDLRAAQSGDLGGGELSNLACGQSSDLTGRKRLDLTGAD